MSNHSRILHRRSAVSGTTPTQLSAGELAMNIHDGLLFVQNISGGIESFSSDRYAPFVLDTELSACAPQYGGNTVTQIFSNVLGGYRNDVSGAGSSTVNGENNDIQGDFSFIGSGADNKILASGDFSAILGGQSNAISHQNSFTIGSNLSSHADNFTYVNNLSGILWGEGVNLRNLNASNISSGALAAARLPAFSGDVTTIAGTTSATVVKLQGNVISTQAPAIGQMLQWSGIAWEPGSVGGSGLVKTINGVFQTPASLLVDVDVASNAQIAQSKIYNLTTDLGNKLDKSGGTISGNLTVTGTFSTVNTELWQSTYTTVQNTSASWSSVYSNVQSNSANSVSVYSNVQSASANWNSVYSNVQGASASYVTLSATQTLTNKTVIDWMTLVRGYKTTPTLLATIGTGEVYSYVYTSSPSDKTYYRFIATAGDEDAFYASFNGTAVSNLIAGKGITI